jgi:type I restriction enzyme, S subunit
MTKNYKRLGDYIQELKVRNTEEKAEKLLGINIDKFFMPSVANVVGTDMSVYKIVKKNQFACNRMHVGRDYRLPVSMSKTDEEFIVSPAYDVFEISDTEDLYPEYLMMWFTRREFDRNAWFYTDADVRGGLHWKALIEMQLPIPSITKQKEIVKEYNVIQNRIALNQQLTQKLEETAQAIYKQWFVEFEFPDENGKPYKSSGGEMVWNEELQKEIPKGWEVGKLNEVKSSTLGGDWGKDLAIDNYTKEVFCIRGTDIPASSIGQKGNIPTRYILDKNLINRKLDAFDIVTEISGGSPTQSTGRSVFISEEYLNYLNKPAICSNFCRVIKAKKHFEEYLFCTIKYLYNAGVLFTYENSSNGVKNLALEDLFNEELIAIPMQRIVTEFKKVFSTMNKYMNAIGIELEISEELRSLLLSKIATIEN